MCRVKLCRMFYLCACAFFFKYAQGVSVYPTPCPDVFEYRLDAREVLYGVIEIQYPEIETIQLTVELSVGNNIQGLNGEIRIAKTKEATIDDVLHKRPIRYYLHFPLWKSIPPKVISVRVNGYELCSGPPIDFKTVPVLTTVTLQHKLTLSVTPPVLPAELPRDRWQENVFFNPTDNQNNVYRVKDFEFNPQPPKDPTKLYTKNPFLTTLTTNQPLAGRLQPPIQDIVFTRNPFLNGSTRKWASTKPVTPPTRSDRPFADVCGRVSAVNNLVAHGSRVALGSYPWLGAIYTIKSTGLDFTCGATLISKRHVVTAAHCVKTDEKNLQPRDILVTLGRSNIMNWWQDRARLLPVSKINIHKDYVFMSADADVVVITVRDEVEFSNIIKPICLWTGNADLKEIVGEKGAVVGWGRDENGNLVTEEPKQVLLPVVSQEMCKNSHATFKDVTSNRTFCAGNRDGRGPCNGDSGGGFVMKKDDLFVLRGVVSLSIFDHKTKCDLNNYVAFTDAAKFKDWILSFIYN